jgi:hypothetical protein
MLQAWREPLGLVFGAAALRLAAHAAIDSWLAPEAGTGASEHLLRLTATVAILAAAVVLYARLPAGGRAALSAAVGLLALVGAFLAIADAGAVGARDEDWSGFLLLPVGIVLLGLSGRQLWRSRKQGGRRHLRRAGIALAALLAHTGCSSRSASRSSRPTGRAPTSHRRISGGRTTRSR